MATFLLYPIVGLGIGYYLGSKNVYTEPIPNISINKELLKEIEKEFKFKNNIIPNVKDSTFGFTEFEKLCKDIEKFNKKTFNQIPNENTKQFTVNNELKDILSKRRLRLLENN